MAKRQALAWPHYTPDSCCGMLELVRLLVSLETGRRGCAIGKNAQSLMKPGHLQHLHDSRLDAAQHGLAAARRRPSGDRLQSDQAPAADVVYSAQIEHETSPTFLQSLVGLAHQLRKGLCIDTPAHAQNGDPADGGRDFHSDLRSSTRRVRPSSSLWSASPIN